MGEKVQIRAKTPADSEQGHGGRHLGLSASDHQRLKYDAWRCLRNWLGRGQIVIFYGFGESQAPKAPEIRWRGSFDARNVNSCLPCCLHHDRTL